MKPFFGGVPTWPDVVEIRKKFPDDKLAIGTIIPYEDIEGIIGKDKDSSRFKAVTKSWRKAVEKETNKIIGAEAGTHFIVLTESQKVDLSGSKLRSAGRAARRAYVVAARVDKKELTKEELDRLNHNVTVSSKVLASAQRRDTPKLPTI